MIGLDRDRFELLISKYELNGCMLGYQSNVLFSLQVRRGVLKFVSL